jgi:hypothetical protein
MKTMEKDVDFSVLVRGAAPEQVFDTFSTAEGLNRAQGWGCVLDAAEVLR